MQKNTKMNVGLKRLMLLGAWPFLGGCGGQPAGQPLPAQPPFVSKLLTNQSVMEEFLFLGHNRIPQPGCRLSRGSGQFYLKLLLSINQHGLQEGNKSLF